MKINKYIKNVAGFQFAGVAAGIKKDALDVGLVYSACPAQAAAVFTTNKFPAAPVLLSKLVINKGKPVRAILANSGNANACTGEAGKQHSVRMQAALVQKLPLTADEVLVASTGVIGRALPIDLIEQFAAALVGNLGTQALPAAQAIMTTDTYSKECSVVLEFSGKTVTIGGIAKGSGMIRPDLATMLTFLVTDAALDRDLLQVLLEEAMNKSFNRITVDGDMSTNDTVFLLANGASGVSINKEETALFAEGLNLVCLELAKELVKDAEGATKFLEVQVLGSPEESLAETIAFQVAESLLVKTALFGNDPNWGRIIAAVGSVSDPFDAQLVSICLCGELLVEQGEPVAGVDLAQVQQKMAARELLIVIDLHQGTESCSVYTSDLSYDYVKINAEYTT